VVVVMLLIPLPAQEKQVGLVVEVVATLAVGVVVLALELRYKVLQVVLELMLLAQPFLVVEVVELVELVVTAQVASQGQQELV
jgi:hypothetical protein